VEGWFKYGHTEWDQRRRSASSITPEDFSPRYYGGLFPTATYNGPQSLVEPGVAGFPSGVPNVTLATPPHTSTDPSLRDPRLFNTDVPAENELNGVHVYTLELSELGRDRCAEPLPELRVAGHGD
jgi:hypothetical protein